MTAQIEKRSKFFSFLFRYVMKKGLLDSLATDLVGWRTSSIRRECELSRVRTVISVVFYVVMSMHGARTCFHS
jgi:hypothetical protein